MKINIVLFIILLSAFSAIGQKERQISIAFMDEEIAYPFTRLTQLNPGVTLGWRLWHKEKGKFLHNLQADLGGFIHKKVKNAAFAKISYRLNYSLFDFLEAEALIGLGYLHSFYPGVIYEMKEDGSFSKKNQWGSPHLIGEVGVGFAFPNKSKFIPFIRQNLMIETPSQSPSVSILPHALLSVGITFKFTKNEI